VLHARRRDDEDAGLQPLLLGADPDPTGSLDAQVELVLVGMDVRRLGLARLETVEVGLAARGGGQAMTGQLAVLVGDPIAQPHPLHYGDLRPSTDEASSSTGWWARIASPRAARPIRS